MKVQAVVKRQLQATLRRRGLRIEPIVDRAERQRLENLMPAAGVKHVVDVGANVGQFASRIRATGFAGRIDSFEPVGDAFQALSAAFVRDQNWHGHRAAVTAAAGAVTMNLYPESVLNSLSPTTNEGTRVFGAYQRFEVVGLETVPGVPLDEAGLPDVGPVFLKIDTQGHDWQVMAGAERLLQRVVMLSMELSFVSLYEEAVPAWESLRRLEQLGFGLAAIDTTVCPADDPLLVAEADGIFMRRQPSP